MHVVEPDVGAVRRQQRLVAEPALLAVDADQVVQVGIRRVDAHLQRRCDETYSSGCRRNGEDAKDEGEEEGKEWDAEGEAGGEKEGEMGMMREKKRKGMGEIGGGGGGGAGRKTNNRTDISGRTGTSGLAHNVINKPHK